MFHMMQTVFKTAIPNLGQAIFQDPNLMAGLGRATARAADMSKTQQTAQGIPTPSNAASPGMSGPSQGFDIGSLLGPMMGGGDDEMAGLTPQQRAKARRDKKRIEYRRKIRAKEKNKKGRNNRKKRG